MSQQLKTPTLIDVRGPRFSATLTVIVLAIALATQNVWVLALQAVVFAIGAIRGPQFTPYAFIFKRVVKPRLRGEAVTEDSRPPQFAQSVGFIFALVGLLGAAIGSVPVFSIAVGFALAAAFLNSVFNYCLGCEMYLLVLRIRTR
ncbi:unannotated protein [freshwater metagenome]|uniref:Unannotated protein n=1 Tax=freshwater metagenome TaxID=449393 RepID=A0A6J7EX84_9ZZZZ|nr:DUF4395 family protein [Actinomycetota bacterium]MSX20608.1 DUF4395 family protein [Actinomycetota bacterium]MSX71112.1 DUF4395 family protein [Actinomycetota bacterium]